MEKILNKTNDETEIALATLHLLAKELYGDVGELLEIVLATSISHLVCDKSPVWLLVVGVPASGKTEITMALKGSTRTKCLDTLSDYALSSGYISVNGKASKDLLPELDGKCFIVKDLTALFSLKADTVKKLLGDMCNAFDGSFSKHTPTRGTVTYQSRFSHIGCITPICLSKHSYYMTLIGARYLFYRLPGMDAESLDNGLNGTWLENRKQKIEDFRQCCAAFIDSITIPLIKEEDENTKAKLKLLAQFLAHGRGLIITQKGTFEDEGKTVTYWDTQEKQVEYPYRALEQLLGLARSLALIHGRTKVTEHEIELLRRVVLSSMEVDRSKILSLFAKSESLTAVNTSSSIDKTAETSRRLLGELAELGLLRRDKEMGSSGHERNVYKPVDEFKEIIRKPVNTLDHLADLGITKETPPLPPAESETTNTDTYAYKEDNKKEWGGSLVVHYSNSTSSSSSINTIEELYRKHGRL